jgi:hypothetical protein
MDHNEAKQTGAVERYLLEEMAARERGEFEEHFFECPECAADLRATAGFLDAARRELKRDDKDPDLAGGTGPPPAGRSRFGLRWSATLAGCAAAVLLCVVSYQNVVLLPRMRTEITQLRQPSTLTSLFLVGGNTRGTRDETIPAVTLPKTSPLLLAVDIPTAEQFASYACVLVAPSGETAWSLPVTIEQAKDTVPIVVPTHSLSRGGYTLIVRGYSKAAGQAPADLAQYRFTVNRSN